MSRDSGIPDRIISKAIDAGQLQAVDNAHERVGAALSAVLGDLQSLPRQAPAISHDEATRAYFEAQARGLGQ